MSGVRASRSLSARSAVLVLALVSAVTASCRRDPEPEQGPTPANDAEARTLEDFDRRVKEYMTLHEKAEDGLPKQPTEATPEQIDTHQRELGRRIGAARNGVPQGTLFTPEMQRLIRDHFERIFAARDGAALKASVMDENPVGLTLAVNQRYPDDVPMSTMPPEVLQVLPKIPDGLEYRFVGRHLVIVDVDAHIIADYVPNAIPE